MGNASKTGDCQIGQWLIVDRTSDLISFWSEDCFHPLKSTMPYRDLSVTLGEVNERSCTEGYLAINFALIIG